MSSMESRFKPNFAPHIGLGSPESGMFRQKTPSVVAAIATLIVANCFILGASERATFAQPSKKSELIEVASFSNIPQGVVVSKKGRIFINFPYTNFPLYTLHDVSVGELLPNGQLKPYPDSSWNKIWGNGSSSPSKQFINIITVVMDSDDFLWVLDTGSPKRAGVVKKGAKLVKIDLRTNKVAQVITFNDVVVPKKSYLNDVRVDAKNQFAYITETGVGGLIVVNLRNGQSSEVFTDNSLVQVDPHIPVVNGVTIRGSQLDPLTFDGIALDRENNYLYLTARANVAKTLYRVQTKFLRDVRLSNSNLESKVERVGNIALTDGIQIDESGYIYLSDWERNAILRYRPSGKVEILVQDTRLITPDNYAIGPDGYLYFVDPEYILYPGSNNGLDKTIRPFKVYKVFLSKSVKPAAI